MLVRISKIASSVSAFIHANEIVLSLGHLTRDIAQEAERSTVKNSRIFFFLRSTTINLKWKTFFVLGYIYILGTWTSVNSRQFLAFLKFNFICFRFDNAEIFIFYIAACSWLFAVIANVSLVEWVTSCKSRFNAMNRWEFTLITLSWDKLAFAVANKVQATHVER